MNRYFDIVEDVTEDDVDLSSFDVQRTLNTKIWNNGEMNQRFRRALLVIAKEFIKTMQIDDFHIEDIVLTGSLANYNWSEKYSDIDVHILIDYDECGIDDDIIKDYFDKSRTVWNEYHKDINVFGYPVELYVQDINEPHKSTGIFSILYDEWIKKPSIKKLDKSKVDFKKIKSIAVDFMNQIEKLSESINDCKTIYDFKKLYSKSDELFSEIKHRRKDAMAKSTTEMSAGNIIFKILRRFGYIEELLAIRRKCYNAIFSVEQY